MHVDILTTLVARGHFLSVSSQTDGGLSQDLYFTVLSRYIANNSDM